MKKNGFTLVELLAVIAILAILVIISLPNVMGMFNSAKKNSFTTEVKQIYKLAQQEWISDSMFNTSEKEYGRCSGCSYKELSLTGRSEIQYYIKINKAGNVVRYFVNDGTYAYTFDNPGASLQITNISDEDIEQSTSNKLFDIKEVYLTTNSRVYKGSTLTSGYDTYQEAINKFGGNIIFKYKLLNNKVEKIYVGYLHNGNDYYLDVDDSYANNKSLLLNNLGSICEEKYNYGNYGYSINCPNSNYTLRLEESGTVHISSSGNYCQAYSNFTSCNEPK